MRRSLRIKIIAAIVGALIGAAFAIHNWATDAVTPAPNELQHISGPIMLPFDWAPAVHGAVTNPQGTMIIPVTIGGCKRFRMLFDLGAPSSMLYRPKMDNLGERCAVPPMIERGGQRYALNMDIVFGEAIIYAPEIVQRQTSGQPIDWANPEKPELIGAMGADFIETKVVVIDYPAKKLFIGDAVPGDYSPPSLWGTLSFQNRRVWMDARIDGRDTKLWFDTGVSSGGLEMLADQGTWNALAAAGATPEVFAANLTGQPVTLHRVKSGKPIELAGATLTVPSVTRAEGAGVGQTWQEWVVYRGSYGARVGGALFADKVLVLDMKQGKFGFAQKK